jgi:hypothetical protein
VDVVNTTPGSKVIVENLWLEIRWMTPKRSQLTLEGVFGQFELKFQGSDGDLFATLRKPNPHVKRAGDFRVTNELKRGDLTASSGILVRKPERASESGWMVLIVVLVEKSGWYVKDHLRRHRQMGSRSWLAEGFA